MKITAQTQAILLLTAHFTKTTNNQLRPLTPTEWGRFANWLHHESLTPGELLEAGADEKLKTWVDSKITRERIDYLLNRGSALALACEKWLRAGLWVITRTDADYPKRFKQHLKYSAPAILFGCGNRALLNQGGIAVVGSRKTSNEDLKFSRDIGAKAANEGCSIISGGARGIDEAAMMGALDKEGTVVGVLADSLLKATSSAKYRKHLMNNNLVLISTFYPEAGFNVGNAMQRNKYIYCLSDAAIAVHSGTKGGTWTGVLENIKKNYVPIWVKETTDTESGNAALVKNGAKWLSSDINKINFEVLTQPFETIMSPVSDDIFSQPSLVRPEPTLPEPSIQNISATVGSGKKPTMDSQSAKEKTADTYSLDQQEKQPCTDQLNTNQEETSFYQFFLRQMEKLCDQEAKTVDELLEVMKLTKTQLNSWLKQAVKDEKLRKFTRPVRYQWYQGQQDTLFK